MENDAALSLLAEWEERRDRGEAVTPEELCAAAPHLVAELRRLIRLLEGCDHLLATDQQTLSEVSPVVVPLPNRVGGYEIKGELGQGGMGVVYRGWDPALRRIVAIKMLCPAVPSAPEDARRLAGRFRQEGQVLARLRHESIVPVYEAKLDDVGPYFVMEYVAGGSLAEHRERLTAAGPAVIAAFLEQVARAVAHAHTQGVLHRDLKPGNILLDADGNPRVSDFGLAKLLDPAAESDIERPATGFGEEDTVEPAAAVTQLTAPGQQPGTRAYMAPEQFDAAFGAVGPATDIWALGVILYELLAGRRPFLGSRWSELRDQVCRGQLPPFAQGVRPKYLHRRLENVVRRCLEKDPSRRFRTAEELANALRNATALSRRKWIAGSLAAAIGLTALGYALWQRPDSTTTAKPPAYPNLPEVQNALAQLARGEEIDLVNGGPPTAFDWPMGPDSGRILQRDDGTCTLYTAGLSECLLEFLPTLPPGRYQIDASLRHGEGDGQSCVGIYAGGSRCQTADGLLQNFFVSLNYADLGEQASITGPGGKADPGGKKGSAKFEPTQLGQSTTKPHDRHSLMLPPPKGRSYFDSARSQSVPPDWRTVSIVIDNESIAGFWEGKEFHRFSFTKIAEFHQSICEKKPELDLPEFAANFHGSLGIIAAKGLVSVRSFRVKPLPSN